MREAQREDVRWPGLAPSDEPDALAPRRTVPGSLEPFEGEGWTGTVVQESFESGTVTGRDVDRGIDAERADRGGESNGGVQR